MRLQASQRRKTGTVKTQAYNTPATKPDVSPVQLVDDSAWETVKAQARHSPATSTVFSTIHPAADSACRGAGSSHPMDPGVSVQKQNFARNPEKLAKVPGTREETKSHLH